MNEAEWVKCSDPTVMLQYLHRKKMNQPSGRKLRLFACACCRRVWHLIQDSRSKRAVEVAERFADKLARAKELTAAVRKAHEAYSEAYSELESGAEAWLEAGMPDDSNGDIDAETVTAREAAWLAASSEKDSIVHAADQCSNLMGSSAFVRAQKKLKGQPLAKVETAFRSGKAVEAKDQAQLLRHIIGNPFRPDPAPRRWPTIVVALAKALYSSQDCAFALHDALLETGHAKLADHFRQEQSHPKGCWLLDLILGKQ